MKATRRRKSTRRSGLVWHKPPLQRPPRLLPRAVEDTSQIRLCCRPPRKLKATVRCPGWGGVAQCMLVGPGGCTQCTCPVRGGRLAGREPTAEVVRLLKSWRRAHGSVPWSGHFIPDPSQSGQPNRLRYPLFARQEIHPGGLALGRGGLVVALAHPVGSRPPQKLASRNGTGQVCPPLN